MTVDPATSKTANITPKIPQRKPETRQHLKEEGKNDLLTSNEYNPRDLSFEHEMNDYLFLSDIETKYDEDQWNIEENERSRHGNKNDYLGRYKT